MNIEYLHKFISVEIKITLNDFFPMKNMTHATALEMAAAPQALSTQTHMTNMQAAERKRSISSTLPSMHEINSPIYFAALYTGPLFSSTTKQAECSLRSFMISLSMTSWKVGGFTDKKRGSSLMQMNLRL